MTEIDLVVASCVDRDRLSGVLQALIAHVATIDDALIDVFGALDDACYQLVEECVDVAHESSWRFWAGSGFGLVTDAARVGDRPPTLADALGDVTVTGTTLRWTMGATRHCAAPRPRPSGATPQAIQLHLPACFGHAAAMRAVVRATMRFADDTNEAVYLIAATEVFTNAVRANHRRAEPPDVVVGLEFDDGRADALTIADCCGGWVPGDPDDLEPESGLAIARAFVPGLTHEATPGGCLVRLPLPPP